MSAPSRQPRGVRSGGQFTAVERAEPGLRLMYQVAPSVVADSMREHGLDHTRGEPAYPHLDFPSGNYLFGDLDDAVTYATVREDEERDQYGPAEAFDYDVYEVEVGVDVTLHDDPFADDESGLGRSAVYATSTTPAERVRPAR